MRTLLLSLTAHCALLPAALASCSVFEEEGPNNASVTTIYQSNISTSWLENISRRPNGMLVVTRADVPEVWTINVTNGSSHMAATIPNARNLFGITDIEKDVFAIVAGNVSLATATPENGTFSVWKVDFNSDKPAISIIAAINNATWLNGMTTFRNDTSTLVLIADTSQGVIYRLNVDTGNYSIALADQTMRPDPNQPLPIGVNGVKVLDNYVYYTSSTQQVFVRVPVNEEASATGSFESIASGFSQDDFFLSQTGIAYIETHEQNSVVRVTPDGQISRVAGGQFSTLIPGPTASYLDYEECTLYVTTNGGRDAPVLGSYSEPAKVVAIKLGND